MGKAGVREPQAAFTAVLRPDAAPSGSDPGLESQSSIVAVEAEIKRLIARELHDGVAQSLTTMLIEMENFKERQAGHQSVQEEVVFFQHSTREVLNDIRHLLYDLRGESSVDGG